VTRKRRRLYLVLIGMSGLAIATALVLNAFRDNLVFFYSPSDVITRQVEPGQRIRIGGLVKEGSVVRHGNTTVFVVTDTAQDLAVSYTGMLPDLFREGQGVVAQGKLDATGHFIADEVLAKHDEKYMPPEVADALKRSGHWQEGAATAGAATNAATPAKPGGKVEGYGK
jgi:cytochrome c-type biogenesis protein CcmE